MAIWRGNHKHSSDWSLQASVILQDYPECAPSLQGKAIRHCSVRAGEGPNLSDSRLSVRMASRSLLASPASSDGDSKRMVTNECFERWHSVSLACLSHLVRQGPQNPKRLLKKPERDKNNNPPKKILQNPVTSFEITSSVSLMPTL